MTFLDLVRKVGELGRAKCHPDCDIVVHRREAAMYMGVLRENPELLRELAAQPPAPADEGKADTPEPEPSVIEMTTRLAGQQQCAMGNHVWTPWLLLPNDSYVTCCARTGCGHDVRYDL